MTYCGFISCVVSLWFDVCWCYGVVRLGWCGEIIKQVTSSWSIFIQLFIKFCLSCALIFDLYVVLLYVYSECLLDFSMC